MTATTLPDPSTAFWDKIAARYARKPVAYSAAFDAKITRLHALVRAGFELVEHRYFDKRRLNPSIIAQRPR